MDRKKSSSRSFLYNKHIFNGIIKERNNNSLLLIQRGRLTLLESFSDNTSQSKSDELIQAGQRILLKRRSDNTSQSKSDELATNSSIQKNATGNSISKSRRLKIENRQRIFEIENDSESESSTKNNPQELVPKVKQESDNNHLSSSNPKEQSTIISDNLQISEIEVVKKTIWDLLCRLGKNAIEVQQTIKDLMDLAMAINDHKLLCSDKTLTPEGSGHNRKYVVKTIYELLAALGSSSADELETSTKLFDLVKWLSSTPLKAPATETKAPKSKGLDPAKPSGPELTDVEKSKKKDNKKKTEQGVEDSEVKVTPKGSGNGTPLASGGDKKEESKESAKPAAPKKEDVQTAAPVKVDDKPALPCGEDAKPAPSGKEDIKPAPPVKEEVKPAPTGLEGFKLAPLVKEEAKPSPLGKEEGKSAPSGKTGASDAGVAGGGWAWLWAVPAASGDFTTSPKIGALKSIPPPEEEVKPASSGKTGAPDAGVAGWGWHALAKSGEAKATTAPKTEAPKPIPVLKVPAGQALHIPTVNFTESQAPPPPQQPPQTFSLNNTHSGTQSTGQSTAQNGKIGNRNIFFHLNLPQPQTQIPGQHKPQICETQPHIQLSGQQAQQAQQAHHTQHAHQTLMGNRLEAGYRSDPQTQTQLLDHPTLQIRQTVNHHDARYCNVPQPHTQFSDQQAQQALMGNHPQFGHDNDPQTQTQVLVQPTPQIGEPGSHPGHGNRNVSRQQAQFPGPATVEYIPGVFGHNPSAESQNLTQSHGTQQAGGFGSVAGISQYYSMNPPPFPVQQTTPGHLNVRETNPYLLSVPLTDTSGGITGPTSYPSQRPADGCNHHMDSTRQAFPSHRKSTRPKSKLPGSYDQDYFSDTSVSFSSSESELDLTRDTDRGSYEQDEISNRGGHDTRRCRHERSDHHRSGRVNSSREEPNGENTRGRRHRRKGSRQDEPCWEDIRHERHRENPNREYPRRGAPHREELRRACTYSMGHKESQSVRRRNTAHAEDLQRKPSKKTPIESSTWAGWFGF